MIETVKKLIQIGTSEGVTLSKQDLETLGAKRGDSLKIKVEVVKKHPKHDEVMREYDAFVAEYGQTLKNLAGR